MHEMQGAAEWNIISNAGSGTSKGSETWTETRDTVGLSVGRPQGDAVSAFVPVGIPCLPDHPRSWGNIPPNGSGRMAKVFPASLAAGVQARDQDSQSDIPTRAFGSEASGHPATHPRRVVAAAPSSRTPQGQRGVQGQARAAVAAARSVPGGQQQGLHRVALGTTPGCTGFR